MTNGFRLATRPPSIFLIFSRLCNMQQKVSGTSFLDDIIPDLNTIVLYYHSNSYLSRIRDINWFSGSSPPKTLPRNVIGRCGTVMILCEFRVCHNPLLFMSQIILATEFKVVIVVHVNVMKRHTGMHGGLFCGC